jgi:hypothetical protein
MTKSNLIKPTILSLTMAVIISISSCSNVGEESEKHAEVVSYEHSSGTWYVVEYQIIEKTIDSCQYIIIFGTDGRNIIHKANCRNKFHNYK